jgi:hypothetical protein
MGVLYRARDTRLGEHAVFESGHVPPWPDVVRETLDWLDCHLGPVDAAGAAGR